jgi:hypothetical protein
MSRIRIKLSLDFEISSIFAFPSYRPCLTPIYVFNLFFFFQVKIRPKIPEQDNDNLPDHVNAELSWKHHRMLHESIIVELFQVSLNLGIHDKILVFILYSFYFVRIDCLFNTNFNNISVISWRSVLLVLKNGRPVENATDLSQVTDKLHHIML